jgi:Skp family chaperone for outer membrane proteins
MQLWKKFGKFNRRKSMRKLVVFLCVVGIGVVRLSALDSGKTKAPAVSVSSVPESKSLGVVHFLKIKDECHKVKEFNETLKKNVEAVQKEMVSMASDLEKVGKEYQELADKAANPALTEEARKNIKTEAEAKLMVLRQKENALRDFGTNSEKRISKMGSEENAKILEMIRQKIKEIAQAQGFSIVVDADSPIVFYAADGLDITGPVIEVLNADQPKPAAIAPATSAVTSVKK